MKIFIPGNTPSSKNSKQWTGKILISSKTVMSYRKATKGYYQLYAKQFRQEFDKLEKPVYIAFTFIRKSKHKFDLINPGQTVQDDLVTFELIPDDNADEMIPIFKPYSYDKNNPGVIIEIITDKNIIEILNGTT